MKDEGENLEQATTWADIVLGISTIFTAGAAGAFFGLYWRVLVLDNFIDMETAMISNYLLFALYVPVGILGVIIGMTWCLIAYKFLKSVGVKVSNY